MQVVGVHVNAGAQLTFGGSDENCGMVHLYSAGKLGPEQNNSYTKAISDHLDKHLKIPSGRYNFWSNYLQIYWEFFYIGSLNLFYEEF